MKQRLRTMSALAMAPVLAAGLAACGDSGSGTPTALNIEITEPSPGQVKITAPATSAGGTTKIVLKNSGQGPHEAQLLKVTGGKTVADVQQFIVSTSSEEGAPIPDWIVAGGGVSQVAPGQTGTVTQELDEGSWFIIDDASAEDEDNAPGNVTKGGIVALQVSDGGSDAALPSAAVTIAAKDWSFSVDGTLMAGPNSLKFQNDGKELHHLLAFPLLPGKTVADFVTAMQQEGEPTGPPPVDFQSGLQTTVIANGQALVTNFDFKAGKYVFVCFINDRAGGPPHAIGHQMYSEVTVA